MVITAFGPNAITINSPASFLLNDSKIWELNELCMYISTV